MPLFSLAELQAKATGRVTGIVQAEYDRAYAFAEAEIISYCQERYEAPDASSSKVFKQIGLNLALFHAGTERYNEQNNPVVAELWAIRDAAVEALKALRKGERTADAASVEVDKKLAKFQVPRDSNGDVIGSKFADSEVSTW